MATAVRILSLALLLAITGCYKTELPDRGYNKPGYNKQSTRRGKSFATYTVRRGDTLYSIGRRFGIDHKLLARRNHIRWPYTIYVGQQLSLARTAPRSQYMPVPKEKVSRSTQKSAATAAAPKRDHYKAPAVNNVKSTRLRWPINGTITSRFGRRGSRMHDGIDIAAKEGTPVYAAASGEVVYSDQRLSGYGKLIIVRHSKDLFTAYAHNQRNLVHKGDRVKAGDVLARVGRTGRATAAHLHFEVRRGPTPVDPMVYLPRR